MTKISFKEMGWDQYVDKAYPDGIGKEQREQVQQAFYSGAAIMYVLMGELSNALPTPLAEIAIKALLSEIAETMNGSYHERAKANDKEDENQNAA